MAELVAARALLEHIRSIRRLMQTAPATTGSPLAVANALHEVMQARVCLVSAEGQILGASPASGEPAEGPTADQVKRLNRIDDTVLSAENEFPGLATWLQGQHLALVPVVAAGDRVATLLIGRDSPAFGPGDQILMEYSATLVGLELMRQGAAMAEAEVRRRGAVEQALSALSYSEQEAIRVLFQNLEGDEGVVIASRIADSVGLTRSVIVNALRKLESAGVITSRSLGMKGTYVKVLNRELVPAVKTSS